MTPNRCGDCADLSAWLFNVDGTSASICGACISEVIQVSGIEASLRRVHACAHGFDLPVADCPVCTAEKSDLVDRLASW